MEKRKSKSLERDPLKVHSETFVKPGAVSLSSEFFVKKRYEKRSVSYRE